MDVGSLFAAWWSSSAPVRPTPVRVMQAAAAAVMLAGPVGALWWHVVGLLAAGSLLRLVSSQWFPAAELWDRFDSSKAAAVFPGPLLGATAFFVGGSSVVVGLVAVLAASVVCAVVSVVASPRFTHPPLPPVWSVCWATVRFDRSRESKVRPVVVVRHTWRGVEALYLTSRVDRYAKRSGWVEVSGRYSSKVSVADTNRRLELRTSALQPPAYPLDADVGARVHAQLRRRLSPQRRG